MTNASSHSRSPLPQACQGALCAGQMHAPARAAGEDGIDVMEARPYPLPLRALIWLGAAASSWGLLARALGWIG